MGEFSHQVFELVAQIPKGKVASYGKIAMLMGRPQSGRYVGYALRNEPPEEFANIPAHRVLHADGSPVKGDAFGGPAEQLRMLEEEGVEILANGCVDMKHFLWDGPQFAGDGDFPEGIDWAAELGE